MSRIADQILRIGKTGGLLEGAKLTTGTAPLLATTMPTPNASCTLSEG